MAERCDTGERRKTNNWLCATAFCTPKELEDWSVYIDIAAELIDFLIYGIYKWNYTISDRFIVRVEFFVV